MKYIPFLFPVPIINIKSNENIDINIDSILNKMSFSIIFIMWFLIITIFVIRAIYYNIRMKNSIDEMEKVLYFYKRNIAIFMLCICLITFSFYLIIYTIYILGGNNGKI